MNTEIDQQTNRHADKLMSFGLGLWQKCGHLDFYPSGGRYHQKQFKKCTNQPNNKLMSGQTDKNTKRKMDQQTVRKTDKQTNP